MIRKAAVVTVLIAVFGLFLGLTTNACAQEKDDWIKPITKQGSAAFMFTIDGLAPFNISGPGIGTVVVADSLGNPRTMMLSGAGAKYFIADDMALRFGLGFRTSSSGADSVATGAVSTTAWGVAVGVEVHPRPLYSTSPYVGAQFSYASGSFDDKKRQTAGKDIESKSSTSTFDIGALAGFDWFVARSIAIGAEVSIGFSSTSSSTTDTDVSGNSKTVDNPAVSGLALATSAAAHVIVYF